MTQEETYRNFSLGIVVVNFFDSRDTIKQLDRLKQWNIIQPAIYLVDVDRIENQFEAYRSISLNYLPVNQNYGYAGNNNIGIKKSLADGNDWTLLLNNDAVIEEEEVLILMKATHTLKDVFSFGPIINEHFKGQSKLYLGGRNIAEYSNTRMEYHRDKNIGNIATVTYNIGAIIFLNSSGLEKVGLLDEDFFFSGEIADLCYRAKLKGLKSVTVCGVTGGHFKEDSQKRKYLYKYYTIRNRFLFLRKYKLAGNLFVKWYIILLKDLCYHVVCFNRKEVKTNLLILRDVILKKYGNRNELFENIIE